MDGVITIGHQHQRCGALIRICIWPASCEKGPSDITNSVDQDQPTYNIQNAYTWSKWLHSKKNMCHWCDECQKVQTLTRRGVGDAAAGLGLHYLHMSKGPFSGNAGHMIDAECVCVCVRVCVTWGWCMVWVIYSIAIENDYGGQRMTQPATTDI